MQAYITPVDQALWINRQGSKSAEIVSAQSTVRSRL